uniref:Cilia and flagella associated protein 251 n=1 Tax=Equus asinus TaxID=9793 RepID=A0A9L0KAJ6_EQUAS
MTWSFGWNSSLPVYYIRDENQRVLLYVCAHTAIIYNVSKNDQHHLQVSKGFDPHHRTEKWVLISSFYRRRN